MLEIFFDSKDRVLEAETVNFVETELKINGDINKDILPVIRNRKRTNINDSKAPLKLNMQDIHTTPVAFMKYIKLQTWVKSLDLSNSNLTHETIKQLVDEMLNGNLEIHSLCLNRNTEVDDEMCKTLSKLIMSKSTLIHLRINETSVTADGL